MSLVKSDENEGDESKFDIKIDKKKQPNVEKYLNVAPGVFKDRSSIQTELKLRSEITSRNKQVKVYKYRKADLMKPTKRH